MKKILYTILLLFVTLSSVFAQAVRDGAMEIRYRYDRFYTDCGTDEIGDEEFVTNARMRDYPDLDATGWIYSGIIPWTGSFAICGTCCEYTENWGYNRTFTYGARNSLGPIAAPLGIQLGFLGWEDDCFNCAGGTICLGASCGPTNGRITFQSSCPCSCDCLFTGGDDAYSDREMTATTYNAFRGFVPNAFNYRGTVHTGQAGYTGSYDGIHYGAQYSTFWTPPCPDTFWTDRPVICDPGYVTLQSGGAVFGGTYRWYYETPTGTPIFIQETADSFYTVYVPATTSYRVYTKNPVAASAPAGTQEESWSYRRITIFQDKPNVDSINVTDPLCAGGATGTITIYASTAIPPLEYSINNGATWQSSNTFTGLVDDIYLVKVKNPACEVPPYGYPIRLSDPAPLITNIENVDSVKCNGGNTGRVNISVTGGTGPYTFNWTPGGSTAEDLINVVAGSYNVTVTDAHACTSTLSATVYQPSVLAASISGTNVSCAGAGDGTATVVASGGTPPYSYLWSNGATSSTAGGLSGGTYTVIVRDRNLCEITRTLVITEAPPLSVSLITTHVNCYGANDGSVEVDLSTIGGTAPYSYAWSPAGPNAPLNSGLGAGTYQVTVTDNAGCTGTNVSVVTQPDSLRLAAITEDVQCAGEADGSIDVTVLGGVFPYTYSWTGGITSSSEDLSGLSGGTYNLEVTDNHGCILNSSFAITEPLPLTANITNTNVDCAGGADAMAYVSINGGTAPYDVLWSTFDLTDTINALAAGDYTVIVTDDNGCMATDRITVTEPTAISIMNETILDVDCFGGSDGAITYSVVGGSGSYSFVWSNAAITQNVTGLAAGVYTLTITDAVTLCPAYFTFTVSQPTQIITEVNPNNPLCYDNRTGFAVVNATGGVSPYTYAWGTTPGQSGIMATNLSGGTYYVTVTDNNGCQSVDSTTLVPPAAISITLNSQMTSCFGGNDGSVVVHATGGEAPYRYFLNGLIMDDSTAMGLTAGSYQVQVIDNNACSGDAIFRIDEPSDLTIDVTASPKVIVRGMTSQLQTATTSTAGIIMVAWEGEPSIVDNEIDYSGCVDANNCSNPIVMPSQTTLYTVTVMDADSCSLSDTVRVVVLQDHAVFIPNVFSPNASGNANNELFSFNILGAERVEVRVFDRWGEEVYYNENQPNGSGYGWDGRSKDGVELVSATYVYQFKVDFFDGKTEVISGTVTLLR